MQLEKTTSAYALLACAQATAAATALLRAALLSVPYPQMLAPDVALAELTDRTAWVAELMLVMVQAAPVVLPRWEYAPPPAQDTRTDLPMSAVVNWACAGELSRFDPDVMVASVMILPSPLPP